MYYNVVFVAIVALFFLLIGWGFAPQISNFKNRCVDSFWDFINIWNEEKIKNKTRMTKRKRTSIPCLFGRHEWRDTGHINRHCNKIVKCANCRAKEVSEEKGHYWSEWDYPDENSVDMYRECKRCGEGQFETQRYERVGRGRNY